MGHWEGVGRRHGFCRIESGAAGARAFCERFGAGGDFGGERSGVVKRWYERAIVAGSVEEVLEG